jgi:hypothetical protein
MAIRTIEFTVFENGISPGGEILAGVQNEHLATEIQFNFDDEFKGKLKNTGDLYYRFELYDGAGGMHTSEPEQLDLNENTTLSKILKQCETASGGKLQLYLVISNGDIDSELILYNQPAHLALSPLPHGTKATEKAATDLSLLINKVKSQGEQAASAALDASDAADKAIEKANEISSKAQNGDFNGEKGDKGDKGDNGKDGINGIDGKDYILTEADKTEIANMVLDIMPNGDEVSY